jgi:ubiquinone/menaquinone biosynthesis C-methylase UbiE
VSGTKATWPWQRLNEGNVSAHQVLATLLDPEPGERWLDVGTGGGGLAFQLARAGAEVVGVDVAEDGLEHARAEAASAGVDATFLYGDAQELPFEDASFDGVASAFGVIFAPDRERAAGELARVCRPEGKLGLTLMPMDSRAGEMFNVLARHGGVPAHPATWAESVEQLLGDAFELEIERRDSPQHRDPPPTWEESVRSFGPLRTVVERLDEDGVAALRGELEALDERYRDVAPSYVLALGRRR